MRDSLYPDSSVSYVGKHIGWTLWALIAAFGAYFSMYAFRKPFTVAPFEAVSLFGIQQKEWLIAAQVVGYTISKFLGIRFVSGLSPAKRGTAILLLIGIAEGALLLFALTPPPLSIFCLLLNGLPLGMVFGLVLGFLEGRQMTELLTAGLCASFIVADGVMKSIGLSLLERGVTEQWMPFVAGAIFMLPLALFVWMLERVPKPSQKDVAIRSERIAMTREQRLAMYRRSGLGLFILVAMYLGLTVVRSFRADFANQIWTDLGVQAVPTDFTRSELWIALGVLIAMGLLVLVKDNRKAFDASLAICAAGFCVMLLGLSCLSYEYVSPFGFMVMVGLGTYLPYVAIQTAVFERLLAVQREPGNLAFLMYLADAYGYLGYVAVMFGKNILPSELNALQVLNWVCWVVGVLSLLGLGVTYWFFSSRTKQAV